MLGPRLYTKNNLEYSPPLPPPPTHGVTKNSNNAFVFCGSYIRYIRFCSELLFQESWVSLTSMSPRGKGGGGEFLPTMSHLGIRARN